VILQSLIALFSGGSTDFVWRIRAETHSVVSSGVESAIRGIVVLVKKYLYEYLYKYLYNGYPQTATYTTYTTYTTTITTPLLLLYSTTTAHYYH